MIELTWNMLKKDIIENLEWQMQHGEQNPKVEVKQRSFEEALESVTTNIYVIDKEWNRWVAISALMFGTYSDDKEEKVYGFCLKEGLECDVTVKVGDRVVFTKKGK